MRIVHRAVFLWSAAFLLLGGCKPRFEGGGQANMPTQHVVFLGASVGKEWKLEYLPARAKRTDYSFESLAVYQFDKTEAVRDILLRPKRRFRPTRSYLKGLFRPAPKVPDIVVIKECAAYFPGEEREYEALVAEWVRRFRERGVRIVLATVLPVTRERDAAKPGQMGGITAFNRWVRDFALQQGIGIVDLAAALEESAGGYLVERYTSGDGLHLNREAYDLLDQLLLLALDETRPESR